MPPDGGMMAINDIQQVELVEVPIFKGEPNVENRLTVYKDSYELHFGPLLHPVLGEAKPAMKLWFRVEPGQGVQLKGKIVRHHTFTSMADFQPVSPAVWVHGQEANSLEDKILHTASLIASDKNRNGSLLCDPPIYSTDTQPRSLADFYFTPHIDDSGRPNRQNIPWFCYFSDRMVPMAADKEAVDRAASIPSEAKAELESLLAERPIISRLAVYCMASPSLRPYLKALLPAMAYYFVNGPWRHTWVKYGLDPRQSPEYRKQQIIECRNIYTPSRSTVNKQQSSRGRRGGMQQVKRRASGHAIPENGHVFDGVALNGNFFMYQLCDLVYDETRAIVDDHRLVAGLLSEKEGWYQDGTLAKLRDIVKRRWQVLREKVKAPAYADFEREQAELEDVLMSGVASTHHHSSSGQPSPFSAADFAGIIGDDIASPFASGDSDVDDFFIFDE